MRLRHVVFTALIILFVYKLALLTPDTSNTPHKFRIYRDEENIPHIYAKTHNDMFFAIGYAQAQDRLWSLFVKKMYFSGRLAEMFGKEALACDLEMRNLNILNLAKKNAAALDRESRSHLQAYADGINEYARSTKMLPFQFYLLWLTWEEWKIEDSLAAVTSFSFNLEFDWFYEIARQRVKEVLGFPLSYKIIPFGSRNLFRNTSILNEDEIKSMGRYKPYDYKQQQENIFKHWGAKNLSFGSVHLPKTPFLGGGSNSWVISGEHTRSGKPILSNDPHLANMMPSLFYAMEVVLLHKNNTVNSRIFGVMVDGLPSISIGINDYLAWGSTAAYIDNKDVYYETTRHSNGQFQYLHEGAWRSFTPRTELMQPRGAEPFNYTFYHNHRGVVIDQIFPDVHVKYGFPFPEHYRVNHTLTLNSFLFEVDKTTVKGMLGLITQNSLEEHKQYSQMIKAITIDGVFILKNGSIGYAQIGGVNKRDTPEMGSFLKDGRSDDFHMKEILNSDEMPTLVDPAKGYFALGNNRFAPDSYEFRSSIHQVTSGRAYRIDKLLKEGIAANKKFNIGDMMEMQVDVFDQFLAEIFPQLLSKMQEHREIWKSPKTEAYFNILRSWNYQMWANSTGAGIYHVWEHLWHKSLFHGSSFLPGERVTITSHAFFEHYQFNLFQKIVDSKLTEEEVPVCLTNETVKYRSLHPCEASVLLALKNLPDELELMFGSFDLASYQWGKIHQQKYKSIPFSDIPVLSSIWGRSQASGGSSRTINVAIITQETKSFDGIGGPSFRFITDMDQTYYSLRIGNTDRIFSKFYDSFFESNRYVKYERHNPFANELPQNWVISVSTM